jgi:hypothetical protein
MATKTVLTQEELADDLMLDARKLIKKAANPCGADPGALLDRAIAMLIEARDLLEEPLWCTWCDRPRESCRCADDPNGVPAGHWSLEVKA